MTVSDLIMHLQRSVDGLPFETVFRECPFHSLPPCAKVSAFERH